MQRYYGESLPFGLDFSPANMGYLAVEQALADYAVLVQQLKETYQITNVVALGGRSVLYSGNLSIADTAGPGKCVHLSNQDSF